MIPKEDIFRCVFFATFLLTAKSQNAYDTNDWVPIANKCPSCSTKDAVIEQKPTGRVLNLHEPVRDKFFPEEHVVRTKKSNNDQYLREVSPPAINKPFQRQPEFRQQSFQSKPNFQTQLNEGEILNQFFAPANFEQQRQPHLLFQQFPSQFIFPPENPPFAYRNQFPHPPLLKNPLLFPPEQTRLNSNFAFQEQNALNYTKPNSFQSLNPEIINQALSPDIVTSSNTNFREVPVRNTSPKPSGDSVQLLYVPVDSLNKRILPSQSQTVKQEVPFQPAQFNPTQDFRQLPTLQAQQPPTLLNNNFQNRQTELSHEQAHKQQQLLSIQHDFAQQALDALNLQLQLQRGQLPTVVQQRIPLPTTTTTTPVPIITEPSTKKPKPHQPPLAVYMGGHGDVTVSDVLNLLKNAKTISVQDAVGPNSPQVFVGPHNLEAPDGYVKFDLPYLSSLGSNRIERKVDQLPFFVAPVSYKAPTGYSKIPLPAPHVGSVVVSQKDQDRSQDPTFIGSSDVNQFLNPVDNGPIHRFNPTHSTASPSFLKQTINEYELAQINHQFQPQAEFQQEAGAHEYEDSNNFQAQPEFSHTTASAVPQTHLLQNIPKEADTTRFQQYQNNRFVATSQPIATHQFAPLPESERLKSAVPTRASHYATFSSNAFGNDYVQDFRQSSRSPPRTTSEISLDTPPAPTRSIPTHSESFVSAPKEKTDGSSLSQVRPIDNNKYVEFRDHIAQNNFDQYQQNHQEIFQNKKQVKPMEIINGPLLEPSYLQLNEEGEYVPMKSNHHISHKLSQQPLVQDVQVQDTPSSTTEVNRQKQSFTSVPTIQSQPEYSFRPRQRVSPPQQNVILDSVTEDQAQEDFRLPPELPTIHPEIHSLINNLQDQSIRPLLVPALIAPTHDTSSGQQPIFHSSSTEPPYITTTPVIHTTTQPTSTTTAYRQRQRGRQRAKVSTTTYATPSRRTQQPRTRRPLNIRTTTVNYQEEYPEYSPTRASRVKGGYSEEYYHTPEPTQRSTSRQRIRTRGRTTPAPPPETPNLTERAFNQPELISGFEASPVQPHSYMQFEHQIIPTHGSTEAPVIISKPEPQQNQMNVDVIIKHPVEPVIISEPEGDSHYVRFSSNIDTSNIVTQQAQETTTPSYVRINAKGRVRSRIRSTTTSTTTPSTTTTTAKEEPQEFYGFFRPPNFNSPQVSFYSPTHGIVTRRPTYISSNSVIYDDQPVENSNNVDIYSTNNLIPSSPTFVGELITKYTPTTERTTTEVPTSKPTRPKFRTRVRVPSRKVTEDGRQQSTTPPSEVRIRTRGRSHFVSPKIRDHNQSEDEEVEGGNYPKLFPKSTERPSFQITIEPIVEESSIDEDQIPYSSIHRPKFVITNSNGTRIVNDLIIDRKVIESQEQPVPIPAVSENESTEVNDGKSLMDDILSELDKIQDENESVTNKPDAYQEHDGIYNHKPKGRRRGVWRLVKRPVESFETAESQYVGKISANTLPFNSDGKEKVYDVDKLVSTESNTKPVEVETTATPVEVRTTPFILATPEESFLDSFYKMFDSVGPYEETVESTTKPTTTEPQTTQDVGVTSTELPPVEIQLTTTLPTTQNVTESTTVLVEQKQESSTEPATTLPPTTYPQTESTQPQIWDVKTSTATEISHETEICYRGKCIKSSRNNQLGM
ncbi:hypothetical protein PPYR_01780 [Photinus pyralis]|uniref:Uncharacterized protein n=1 Tax=Photinus pyralis TaxID=7054 RepID=A0A5N4B627_PHOPY|nr:hypothetical protein PPYR_01780 [Photinus pyralis]